MKSRGLGDTIAKVTHFFYIDKLAHFIATKVFRKEDCGCERRRDVLNKKISYKKGEKILLLD
jgi:hypothetical protein